jgi:hypothetical protein
LPQATFGRIWHAWCEAFRRATGTKKALILTMVTTYGVRDHAHRRELVDKSLEMDSLFFK